jgi:hypothetical protein
MCNRRMNRGTPTGRAIRAGGRMASPNPSGGVPRLSAGGVGTAS